MEDVWVVYLCLFLLVLVLILMKRDPDLEAAKKVKDMPTTPPQATYYSSSAGKHLEYTEEELEKSLERLTSILFDVGSRKRETPYEQQTIKAEASHHHKTPDRVSETKELTGKGPGHSQHLSSQQRIQEKAAHPGGTETIMGETEQAVQEPVNAELHMRRRQHQTIPRSHQEGQWSEMTVQSKGDRI